MLADLLIDAAATKLATSLVNSSRGNLVAEVNALGYNLSLSEGNSVACSGAPGVSNTMASNLWVVDEARRQTHNCTVRPTSAPVYHSPRLVRLLPCSCSTRRRLACPTVIESSRSRVERAKRHTGAVI